MCALGVLALAAERASAQTAPSPATPPHPEHPAPAVAPERAFQEALYEELATGNTARAVALYIEIADAASAPRALRAKALLRAAALEERRGVDAARSLFARVVAEHADRPEALAEARAALARLGPAPAEAPPRGMGETGAPSGWEALLADVRHGSEERARAAAVALAESGPAARVVDGLVAALNDGTVAETEVAYALSVRLDELERAGSAVEPPKLDAWVARLADRPAGRSLAGFAILSEYGPRKVPGSADERRGDAIEDLFARTESKEWRCLQARVNGEPPATPFDHIGMIWGERDEEAKLPQSWRVTRRAWVKGLWEQRPRGWRDAIVSLLRASDPVTRECAAEATGAFWLDAGRERLAYLAERDEDARVREAAAAALAGWRDRPSADTEMLGGVEGRPILPLAQQDELVSAGARLFVERDAAHPLRWRVTMEQPARLPPADLRRLAAGLGMAIPRLAGAPVVGAPALRVAEGVAQVDLTFETAPPLQGLSVEVHHALAPLLPPGVSATQRAHTTRTYLAVEHDSGDLRSKLAEAGYTDVRVTAATGGAAALYVIEDAPQIPLPFADERHAAVTRDALRYLLGEVARSTEPARSARERVEAIALVRAELAGFVAAYDREADRSLLSELDAALARDEDARQEGLSIESDAIRLPSPWAFHRVLEQVKLRVRAPASATTVRRAVDANGDPVTVVEVLSVLTRPGDAGGARIDLEEALEGKLGARVSSHVMRYDPDDPVASVELELTVSFKEDAIAFLDVRQPLVEALRARARAVQGLLPGVDEGSRVDVARATDPTFARAEGALGAAYRHCRAGKPDEAREALTAARESYESVADRARTARPARAPHVVLVGPTAARERAAAMLRGAGRAFLDTSTDGIPHAELRIGPFADAEAARRALAEVRALIIAATDPAESDSATLRWELLPELYVAER